MLAPKVWNAVEFKLDEVRYLNSTIISRGRICSGTQSAGLFVDSAILENPLSTCGETSGRTKNWSRAAAVAIW
jgi:hypothetical protein